MPKIIRIEIGRFDYDFVGEFKFFKPGLDGKVRRPTILVRLTTEDGHQGWGQAVPVPSWSDETIESVDTTLRHYLAPVLLGADPTNPPEIHRSMNAAIKPGLTTGQPLCKAAVDAACYDLMGKIVNQSVGELLGEGGLGTLQLSWTIASPDMAMVEQQLEEGWVRGYRNFNVKVGTPQTKAYDIELVKVVKAFSPEGFVWTDANTGYDLETALEMLPKLADAGADVIESPLPPMNIPGYQALKKQGALPIFSDEGMISPQVVETFCALGLIDGLTLKVGRMAGIWPVSQAVKIVKKYGLRLLGSGLSDPDISLAATAHVFSWAGITVPCALNGPQYLANSLVDGDFMPVNDQLTLPTEPGLGLTLLPEAEAALTVIAEL